MTAREIVMGVAVLLTLVTGVDYVARAMRLRAAASSAPRVRPGVRPAVGPDRRAGRAPADASAASSPVAESPSRSPAGWSCAALVSVPGASAVVRGGVVAYMTDLKASLLDVDPELLAREGAVHPDVAARDGARRRRRGWAPTYGVATTGVAGPDPQDGHPVGEVWVAVDAPGLVWERSETVVGETSTRRSAATGSGPRTRRAPRPRPAARRSVGSG